MYAIGVKHTSQIEQAAAIEVQRCNCRSADRSQADDLCIVIAPGEVIAPVLPTRMKERHGLRADRVKGGNPCQFAAITTLATTRQIVGSGFTIERLGKDVVNGE